MENLGQEQAARVPGLLRKLRGQPDETWITALDDLHRAGVFWRRSILPRGDLKRAAPNDLKPKESVRSLLDCLNIKEPIEVPRKAALVLSHWAGAESVAPLTALLNGADSVTQLYCISALGSIGGPEAATSIIETLASTSDRGVREAAISAILDLTTGGSPSDLEDATLSVAGVSRARGQELDRYPGNELLNALVETAGDSSAGTRLQRRAGGARKFLIETGVIPVRPSPWLVHALAAKGGDEQPEAVAETDCELWNHSERVLKVKMFDLPELRDPAKLLLYLILPKEFENKPYRIYVRFAGQKYAGEAGSGMMPTVTFDLSSAPEEAKRRLREQTLDLANFGLILRPEAGDDVPPPRPRYD